MKEFYVIWTYIANHSKLMRVEAESPEQAKQRACGFFGEDFKRKGVVFVFDAPPALIVHRGATLPYDAYNEASRGE